MTDRIDMRATRALEETIGGRTFRRIEPPPRTPLTVPEWCAAVAAAYCADGAAPGLSTLAILWAQYALETGRGRSCFGFNLGNVMRAAGQPFDWCELRTFEYVDPDGAGPRRIERVDTIATFRVFDDAAAGARAYLETLRRPRYARALAAAERGTAADFAHELKAGGFYTAPEDQYAAGIASLAREARAAFGGELAPVCAPLPAGLWPLEYEPIPPSHAATPIRAGEAEHTLATLPAVDFDE